MPLESEFLKLEACVVFNLITGEIVPRALKQHEMEKLAGWCKVRSFDGWLIFIYDLLKIPWNILSLGALLSLGSQKRKGLNLQIIGRELARLPQPVGTICSLLLKEIGESDNEAKKKELERAVKTAPVMALHPKLPSDLKQCIALRLYNLKPAHRKAVVSSLLNLKQITSSAVERAISKYVEEHKPEPKPEDKNVLSPVNLLHHLKNILPSGLRLTLFSKPPSLSSKVKKNLIFLNEILANRGIGVFIQRENNNLEQELIAQYGAYNEECNHYLFSGDVRMPESQRNWGSKNRRDRH